MCFIMSREENSVHIAHYNKEKFTFRLDNINVIVKF